MPYFDTAHEWLNQSALLLQARPNTTRITTKYTIPNSSKTSPQVKGVPNSKKKPATNTTTKDDSTTESARVQMTTSTATLTLKTYDPISGSTLKYRTNKAAEVGRLVQIMGRLGRGMAGLDMKDDEPMRTDGTEKKDDVVGVPSGKKSKKKSRK